MAKAAARTAATGSPSAERRPALAGSTVSATGVKVEVLPPAERISLRAPGASVAALSKAL
ncbi:MAG: sarcosine oxidase subunit gamma, partial [Mesorhizobium sp.]